MKQKIWPLLVVALLALGTLSIVGFQSSASGSASGQVHPSIVVGRTAPQSVVRSSENVFVDKIPEVHIENMPKLPYKWGDAYADCVRISCHLYRDNHPEFYDYPNNVPPDVLEICARYGVLVYT